LPGKPCRKRIVGLTCLLGSQGLKKPFWGKDFGEKGFPTRGLRKFSYLLPPTSQKVGKIWNWFTKFCWKPLPNLPILPIIPKMAFFQRFRPLPQKLPFHRRGGNCQEKRAGKRVFIPLGNFKAPF